MVHLVRSYLAAYVNRRQQIYEFYDLHDQYLKEDIAASLARDTVQLVLVSAYVGECIVVGKQVKSSSNLSCLFLPFT